MSFLFFQKITQLLHDIHSNLCPDTRIANPGSTDKKTQSQTVYILAMNT